MQPFKSILVDIDATTPAHPALERAIRLARECGATLTIAEVLTIPAYAHRYLPPAVEEEMVSRHRDQLARIADNVTGVSTASKLLAGRPATALIQEVLRSNHDLIVRAHARDLAARQPKPFGAIDMELLRKCPCPVLLAGPVQTGEDPKIVGAVNASTDEADERALNVKIVELTLLMAGLEHATPMLVQAWAPFAEAMIRAHYPAAEFDAFVEDVRHRASEDLARLRQPFSDRLSVRQTMLRRGEAEDVIPELVVALGVDLVVMGTVARSGIAGLLIGNTAERVIRKLTCSVLAVKPGGFESPVRLDTPSY